MEQPTGSLISVLGSRRWKFLDGMKKRISPWGFNRSVTAFSFSRWSLDTADNEHNHTSRHLSILFFLWMMMLYFWLFRISIIFGLFTRWCCGEHGIVVDDNLLPWNRGLSVPWIRGLRHTWIDLLLLGDVLPLAVECCPRHLALIPRCLIFVGGIWV